MFAPEGDGCLQRAKREDAGRFSKEGKSLDDFWYFSSVKSAIKEKFLYDSSRRQQAVPCLGDGSRRLPQKAGENFNIEARKHTEIKIPSCNLGMTGFFQIIFLRSACFFLYT